MEADLKRLQDAIDRYVERKSDALSDKLINANTAIILKALEKTEAQRQKNGLPSTQEVTKNYLIGKHILDNVLNIDQNTHRRLLKLIFIFVAVAFLGVSYGSITEWTNKGQTPIERTGIDKYCSKRCSDRTTPGR